jgi:poly-gamma-glutamate capsule biosynthesis protein CapA/YwtB (metallophosphatase superfamily)
MASQERSGLVTLALAGDVMTGRGIDQVLSVSSDPELREPALSDARGYVQLAERRHGPIPAPLEPEDLWGDALTLLHEVDPEALLVNLETSITVSRDFCSDKFVHYRMHPDNVRYLRAAGIDGCSLANNHVMDFGVEGLLETLTVLRANGIDTVGAGRDLQESRRVARIPLGLGGASLLFLGCCSTSSGVPSPWAAGTGRPGVDLLPDLSAVTADEITGRLREEKQPGDIAVVSLHWGSNWGDEVSLDKVAFAHRLVEGGVDLVHGHSSHHVRPVELYQGKLILYGCGDLITDYEGIRGHERWRGDLGALYFATLSLADGQLVGLRLNPLAMRKLSLRRTTPTDTETLQETLNRTSARFAVQFEQDEAGALELGVFV